MMKISVQNNLQLNKGTKPPPNNGSVCGLEKPVLRNPSIVMTLNKLGSAFPSRLSFMRILIRRMLKEKPKLKDPFEEEIGVGENIYRTAVGALRDVAQGTADFTDYAGNTFDGSIVAKFTWTQDETTPLVQSTSTSYTGSDAYTDNVTFTVTFSEDISAFDSSKFTVSPSGPTITVPSISTDPYTSEYNFTITGASTIGEEYTFTIGADAYTDRIGNKNNTTNTYTNIQYAFFFYIYGAVWYQRIYENGKICRSN